MVRKNFEKKELPNWDTNKGNSYKYIIDLGNPIIDITLDDKVDNAYYMSGTIYVGEKLILKIIFQAALLPKDM